MDTPYNFAEGDKVSYNITGMVGEGIVRGVASNAVAVLGASYIIEDTSGNIPTPHFPFTMFATPEVFLRKLQ